MGIEDVLRLMSIAQTIFLIYAIAVSGYTTRIKGWGVFMYASILIFTISPVLDFHFANFDWVVLKVCAALAPAMTLGFIWSMFRARRKLPSYLRVLVAATVVLALVIYAPWLDSIQHGILQYVLLASNLAMLIIAVVVIFRTNETSKLQQGVLLKKLYSLSLIAISLATLGLNATTVVPVETHFTILGTSLNITLVYLLLYCSGFFLVPLLDYFPNRPVRDKSIRADSRRVGAAGSKCLNSEVSVFAADGFNGDDIQSDDSVMDDSVIDDSVIDDSGIDDSGIDDAETDNGLGFRIRGLDGLSLVSVSVDDIYADSFSIEDLILNETLGLEGDIECIKSGLKEYEFDTIIQKIKSQRLYADFDLRLSTLAKMVAVPEYKLRWHINQVLDYRNFNHFVNSFRIEEASELLIENRRLPILSISLEVGFRSISSFNTAFKEQLLVSPSEYRRKLLVEEFNNSDAL